VANQIRHGLSLLRTYVIISGLAEKGAFGPARRGIKALTIDVFVVDSVLQDP
jgi:hypothetical protein